MSIENKIREAFKKPTKKLHEIEQWNAQDHPNLYELANFLRKAGYRLLAVEKSKDYDVPEVFLEPVKKGYLYPEIIHYPDEGKFYVDVIKYGPLERADLEGIMEGYDNAREVLLYLEDVDFNALEVPDSEDEE